ncbi:MAG: phosphatidylserine/phosphatidylglycerophosphate/cardiolipin synthase family protein [Planctomycetota bacterium]
MHRILLTLALTLLASTAFAGDEPTFEGTWRFEGENFKGPYQGLMQVFRLPNAQDLIYERSYDGQNGRPRVGAERGRVLVGGGAVFTQQLVTPGLMEAFSLERARVPQRHGYYHLEGTHKATGLSFVPATFERSRETLLRMGPDAPNNQVDLLIDGREFFPSMRKEMEGAQRSIFLQTFIYTDDPTGQWVGRLLAQRAREGVDVRLLVDALNSKIGAELEREMTSAGVKLIRQHTWGEGLKGSLANIGHGIWDGIKGLFGGSKTKREQRGVLNHDHRKITVVDGRVAYVGGMNVAHEYEAVWHDVQVKVQGRAVSELTDLFYERWEAAGGKGGKIEPAPETAEPGYWPGNMDVDVVSALPGINRDILDRYLKEIGLARRQINVEMAYLLDDRVIGGLKRAARRGVQTTVIVPNDADHDVKIVRDAFAWSQNDVIESGIALFKYPGRMVHTKVASFDGRVATVGSSNLDGMALEKLAEANVFVKDQGFTRTVDERIFVTDVPKSVRVQKEKLGFWGTIKSGFLQLFKGLL